MRGTSHLAMSVFVSLPTFFLLKLNSEFLNLLSAVALGIMLGSLLPDLDAQDSKIMHGWWRPLGLMSKYAFYNPLRRLLGEKSKHREILHSLIGCLFTSSFFALISLVLDFAGVFFIWYIWIGIPIGFLLHLAEDSFTYYEVRWFFPIGEPIWSTTSTGSGSEYFLVSVSFIVFGSMTAIVYYLIPASVITLLLTVGATIVLLVILHRINPRISDIENRRYSLEELVEFYIEDIGGKRIKPREASGPLLKIEYDEEQPKEPYIVPILRVGSEFGLVRDWKNKYSQVEAGSLKEGDVLEKRTHEGEKESRIYYVVQDGTFYVFLKRLF